MPDDTPTADPSASPAPPEAAIWAILRDALAIVHLVTVAAFIYFLANAYYTEEGNRDLMLKLIIGSGVFLLLTLIGLWILLPRKGTRDEQMASGIFYAVMSVLFPPLIFLMVYSQYIIDVSRRRHTGRDRSN